LSGRRLFTADPQKVEVKTPFAKMATDKIIYTSIVCVGMLPMFMIMLCWSIKASSLVMACERVIGPIQEVPNFLELSPPISHQKG
jgi:hypothetical protein